ncbi:IS1595 family transposase [Leptospira fletcheri]|uniref:IS1595 family transposase n=1 Tax=Leptospira fletcheri TaxID=2484981 RepID=A0A4R9GFN1_9LEPT|nr:IS1595 family transposase [Leptospira fletcheri]TGK11359.1 IS1595 family transposase [Leptospira fletcheri]
MATVKTMTFFDILKRFPTQQSVIDYFIKSRYGRKIKCNHCNRGKKIYPLKGRPKFFQCGYCNNSFSIFKGTIFERTRVDLQKWIFAIYQVSVVAKKGISAYQLQRSIGLTYKTNWRMLKQIRIAMTNDKNFELFQSIVEIDETYLGGKPKKGSDTKSKRGRGTNKIAVVGIYDRKTEKVFAQPIFRKEGQNLKGKQLLQLIDSKVAKKAKIYTDEFRGYWILDKLKRKHFTVDHSKEYVAADGTHTNNIEAFWSLLKRMHYGTYHKISPKYMTYYCGEEAFRFSNRSDLNGILDKVLEQSLIIKNR